MLRRIKILGFQRPFYWSTTKKIIVAVGSIFENITLTGDFGDEIRVPLFYSPREKFIDDRAQNQSMEATSFDIIFPAIGFELTGMNFAPERHTNPLKKIDNPSGPNKNQKSFNRVPYDLTFSVTVGAKRFEDSLKIVEQIIPFFSPSINLTIKDREDFDLDTNIDIGLNSIGMNIQYEGPYTERRTILWDLQLTAKAFYYMPVENVERIKTAITEMRSMDFDKKFQTYTAAVTPKSAGKTDPHTIVETLTEGDA